MIDIEKEIEFVLDVNNWSIEQSSYDQMFYIQFVAYSKSLDYYPELAILKDGKFYNFLIQNFNSKNLLPQSFLYILDNYYVPIFKELDCGFPPDPSIAQKIEIFKYFESKDEAYEYLLKLLKIYKDNYLTRKSIFTEIDMPSFT